MKVVNSTINVQCTSVNATKCSSVGDVEIRLLDSKNKVKHTRKVGLDMKGKFILILKNTKHLGLFLIYMPLGTLLRGA
jgi:hypothetical protein